MLFRLFLTSAFVLLVNGAQAQSLTLDSGVTFREAVEERLDSYGLTLDSIWASKIDEEDAKIITAYTKERGNEKVLYCYLYQRIRDNHYRQVFVDSQGINGGLAELVSMFSTNADSDPSPEVIAIYRWQVKHYQIEGFIYEVKCYKGFTSSASALQPMLVQPVSSEGLEGYREGKTEHAKYNTEAKIRRRLRQLGY